VCEVNEQGKSEMVKRVVCKDEWTSLGISSCVEAIIQSVDKEFGGKAELFIPILARMDRREGAEFERTKRPGVYVFIYEDGTCLKVGKNQQNASKRALEHCTDNTCSKDGTIHMADLRNSDKTYMLVFALQGESMHWVLALEYFLEKTLEPRILSLRNG
jgi:hypothetical protein